MRYSLIRVITLAAALCWAGVISFAQGRLITLDDILNGERVNAVQLSNDGTYVLEHFTVTDGPKTKRHSIVRRCSDGEQIARYDSMRVEWMPRTEALLRQKGDSLFRIDLPSGDESLMVTGIPKGRVTMSPTEDYLIVSRLKRGPKEDPDVYRILNPEDRQPGWRDRTYLLRFDMASGDTLRLTDGPYSTYLMDISADGTKLLLSSSRARFTKRPTTLTDFVIMDAATGKADTLLKAAEFLESARFSPDAKSIVVKASPESFGGKGEHILPGQTSSMTFQVLYKVDVASGKVKPLTDRIPQSVLSYDWCKDDGKIYFSAEDRDYQRLYRIGTCGRKIEQLPAEEDLVSSWSVHGGRIAYCGESASNSKRAWLSDTKKGGATLLDDSSARILEGIELGEVHEWNYQHSRGETIYGRYYLPPHFDPSKKYPLVVNYYGGCSPTGRTFESRYPQHLYAAQGYVVYVVQPSGATGFGQEFAARHVNTYGAGGAEDIIEGVEKFCDAHPFVDRQHIGCIGASYGGFMTQYLITRTDMFAAAISHAGISDITSYWGEGYWGYSYSEVSWANSYPWNAADMVVSQSPLFNADKVNTPILFLHGAEDTNVPIGESIQMFTALKLLGKDTEFVAVRGQNHHILDYGKRVKWQNTIFAWFAKYLKEDPTAWNEMYPPVDL